MTTLLISDNFPPKTGGSGRWFWEVYRRLPREHYHIAAGEDARQEVFDRTHDLRVTRLPLSLQSWGMCSPRSLWGYGRSIGRLARLAAAHRVTRVHTGRCLPEGVMSLGLKHWMGLPYLCYIHGEDINTALTSRELRWLVGRVLRGASLLIANSQNTARLLAADWGQSSERVQVLHPGVDTQRFVPAARDPEVRTDLGWGDRPVVLTVGRLQRRKGHDTMIRSLSRVRRSIPRILYAILGDGEERASLEELVRQEGLQEHVQFLGEVDDARLVACYQQCDLFVLANRAVGKDIEGFGMVLLEAQACGRPVVAGDSGGTAETMCVGETGRVVDCETPDSLTEVVIDLLRQPEQLARMGSAGRWWVTENLDWTVLARQAEELFEQRCSGDGVSLLSAGRTR
jgi:phosphatidylinositol alpha-1,6-mannosyltransferase